MTWEAYGSFVAFALLLIVVPGPDFVVTTRNTLARGRGRGAWTAAGVATPNAVQGAAAAGGLGAVIARSEPLLAAIRWAGAAYLAYPGVQALRSAIAGRYLADDKGVGHLLRSSRQWRRGVNETLFDGLHVDASSWEAELAHPLSWERLDEKRASRLAACHPVGDLADDAARVHLRDWAVKTVLVLYDGMNESLRARARELRYAAKTRESAPEAGPASAAPMGVAPPDGPEPAEPGRDEAAGPATSL